MVVSYYHEDELVILEDIDFKPEVWKVICQQFGYENSDDVARFIFRTFDVDTYGKGE